MQASLRFRCNGSEPKADARSRARFHRFRVTSGVLDPEPSLATAIRFASESLNQQLGTQDCGSGHDATQVLSTETAGAGAGAGATASEAPSAGP